MRSKRYWAGVAIASLGLAFSVPAQADDPEMEAALAELEKALPGELMNNPFTTRWSTEGNRVKGKIVKSESAPGGAAFEVGIRERYPEVWEARVKVPLDKEIQKGDEIQVAIWARADKPMRSLGTGNIDLQVVRTEEPYDNVFSENRRPGEEWELLTAKGIAGANFGTDNTVFGINVGYGKQTLQFGTVYILRLSTADQRAAAEAGTE